MRVAILGSCVSRDAVDHWPDEWELCSYHARHPLASLPAPSKITDSDVAAQPKGWRRLQHIDDIASLTVRHMLESGPDLIVWDLADERMGIHVRRDGGRAAGEGVKYHSYAYKQLWSEGLGHMLRAVRGVPVVLNAMEWDESFAKAVTFNKWQRWAARRAEWFGVPVAWTRDTKADAGNRWGSAPFHFRDGDYARSVESVREQVAGKVLS